MINTLESWLAEVTGYAKVSIQPNAGSQGELAGLLAIRAYHDSRGDHHRRICLIPSSAHGTNAASAVMAGMKVVVVKAAADGSVDLDDLRTKINDSPRSSSPRSWSPIRRPTASSRRASSSCATLVHDAGGQVYVDGANLNALLGLARRGGSAPTSATSTCTRRSASRTAAAAPASDRSASGRTSRRSCRIHPLLDVGRGRRRYRADLGRAVRLGRHPADQLRLHRDDGRRRADLGDRTRACSPRTMSPRGSVITTRCSTRVANGRVAHECILDLRPLTKASGITVDDVAKRLIDYGFHAPDDELPGGRHADGRADRVGEPGGARPVLRRHDQHPRRDRQGRVGGVAARRTTRWSTRRTPRAR